MTLDERVAACVSSSLSDDDFEYRHACWLASEYDNAFAVFRRDSVYRRILEHVDETTGHAYLEEIKRTYPRAIHGIGVEAIGDPITFYYPGVGTVSPTTLRYAKVAADLHALFGSLDDLHVVEVGGGYGGQAQIIRALFPACRYTIVDLPETILLARRYLTAVDVTGVEFVPYKGTVPELSADLFLSNYALTECVPAVLDAYVKNIACGAKRGYVTGNAQENHLLDLLKERLPIRVDERPLTGKDNYICVWGHAR